MSAKLESLRADLVEYEEKYERCKAANEESMRQLEALSADFDRVRDDLGKGIGQHPSPVLTAHPHPQTSLPQTPKRSWSG